MLKLTKIAALVSVLAMTTSLSTVASASDLSYDGYTLKWQDDFTGAKLNRADWNVELHEPGWVNNELQEYVDSEDNIYQKDGLLVIKPLEHKNPDGSVSYTSGRITTQNKQDFKYGIFEARIKVPSGQGLWPAFWMMPTDENLYKYWPRCGEIDIMEVLGHDTTKSYGTIHFGDPHSQSQGIYEVKEGEATLDQDFHDYAVEWEPGQIKWYVDGNLIHTANEWYSSMDGVGTAVYPAPFDQPFFVILNFAVGGNWPGYPDETTDIANAALYVDHVKIYQKDSYDENVALRPASSSDDAQSDTKVALREPDRTGNYIVNGDFAQPEELTGPTPDLTGWSLLENFEGQAQAKIENYGVTISTVETGVADYSIQLVQPNLPLQKGSIYQLSFDAQAAENRTMKVTISAPDRAYQRYMTDTTVELTPQKQSYTYTFEMKAKDDANGRLEFNMGAAGSKADITLHNVALRKVGKTELKPLPKTVLPDGNYVYNGGFNYGEGRLAHWDAWEIGDNQMRVTNAYVENGQNVRRLEINAGQWTSQHNPVVVYQSGLALTPGKYKLSFDVAGSTDQSLKVMVGGESFTCAVSEQNTTIHQNLVVEDKPLSNTLFFVVDQPGLYYLDNIRIEKDMPAAK